MEAETDILATLTRSIYLRGSPQQVDAIDPSAMRRVLDEVLAILPHVDINSDYLIALVVQWLPTHSPAETASLVVEHLLDGSNHDTSAHQSSVTSGRLYDSSTDDLFEGNDHEKGQGEKGDETERQEGDEKEFQEGEETECQCCFGSYMAPRIFKCPGDHSFCDTCIRGHAGTQLGLQKTDILCMYPGDVDCQMAFTVSTLEKCLPEPLLALYHRLKQQEALKVANIEGLEECPFCSFACIMDMPLQEVPIFTCQDAGRCGAVSCRICRAKAHPGRSCDRLGDAGVHDGRLALEEAMSKALMRTCPRCDAPFIKEDGCNKMTCPQCEALSCYVCRRAIDDYEHFFKQGSTCPLYDNDLPLNQRHAQEVEEAYNNALTAQEVAVTETKEVLVAYPLPNRDHEPQAQPQDPIDDHIDYHWGEPMDVVDEERDNILDEAPPCDREPLRLPDRDPTICNLRDGAAIYHAPDNDRVTGEQPGPLQHLESSARYPRDPEIPPLFSRDWVFTPRTPRNVAGIGQAPVLARQADGEASIKYPRTIPDIGHEPLRLSDWEHGQHQQGGEIVEVEGGSNTRQLSRLGQSVARDGGRRRVLESPSSSTAVASYQLLQAAEVLARHEAGKARRRLKYAEDRLKELDAAVDARDASVLGAGVSTGKARAKVPVNPGIERSMRIERVRRAKLECEEYEFAVDAAMAARLQATSD